ncbi:MAG: hypothetical protein AABW88_02255 [Nanoarchaeota archaeon]
MDYTIITVKIGEDDSNDPNVEYFESEEWEISPLYYNLLHNGEAVKITSENKATWLKLAYEEYREYPTETLRMLIEIAEIT